MPAVDTRKMVRDICRESLYEYTKFIWPTIIKEPPVYNWHIKYLCDTIQDAMERVFRGLDSPYDIIYNVPPGTTKSTVLTTITPTWCWTRMPHMQLITASHTETLVLKLSAKSRDIIQSQFYREHFPGIDIKESQNTKGLYENTHGGWRLSCTVGGKSPIGFHGHAIFVDDPLDPEKALSQVELETASNFCNKTLPSRKVNKRTVPIILVHQRLADDDPTGVLLKDPEISVKHYCLPAEVTPDIKPAYLKKFYVNGVLDPVRLAPDILEKIRRRIGSLAYARQFLQNAVPPEGGLFKTQLITRMLPPPIKNFKKMVRYWDKAATMGAGCYTVGVLMGLDNEGRYWVLDVVRGQWDSGEREKVILKTAQIDGKRVVVGLEQEPGSGGKESTQATVRRLAGWIVRSNLPKGDKAMRAEPFSSQVNMSNVFMKPGPWNSEFIAELRVFSEDSTDYKDQVDAASGAFSVITFQSGRALGSI